MTGFMTAFAVFMGLNSPGVSDTLRYHLGWQATGEAMVTLSGFMFFWGWVFIVVTILIAVLKAETPDRRRWDEAQPLTATPNTARESTKLTSEVEAPSSIREAYQEMWTVMTLPNVMSLAMVLVTCKIGFAAVDSATTFELVEGGMPQQYIALFGIVYVHAEKKKTNMRVSRARQCLTGSMPASGCVWRVCVCVCVCVSYGCACCVLCSQVHAL